jgi:hypothetical protein
MGTATFYIPHSFVGKLHASSSAVGEILNEVLNIDANTKVICDALAAFHDDGSPVVNMFDVDEVSYAAETGKGKLRFTYTVDYTFGCSDLSPSENATERCDFDINLDQQILNVYIHDPIRRDTLDEF